jgi:tight adherence protein B
VVSVVGVVAVLLAGYGTFLVVTALAGWRGMGLGPEPRSRGGWSLRDGLAWVGADSEDAGALGVGIVAGTFAGGLLGWFLFDGLVAATVAAAVGATLPLGAVRQRRRRRAAAAADAWPGMLEELRTLTGSAGWSIPQALFAVGRHAPAPLRSAFTLAERHWQLTTDFPRTLRLLAERLADPTADIVCETLAVAHELGGGGLDRRLGQLIEDRVIEREGRKDAESKQAGVRFARRFVLLVPLGMAAAGLSIGDGRAAYASAGGQAAAAVALAGVLACWVWSGRLMRVPAEPRVFADAGTTEGRR